MSVARDISKLTKPLSPPTQWLESVDPRLGAMGDLVESGKVDEAADVAEEVLAEGFLDIRPISVLLYAAFHAEGLQAVPDILEAADLVMRDNFDSIGPKDEKKKKLFDKRLAWVFDRIADQLDYHEKTKSGRLDTWMNELGAERMEIAAVNAGALAAALAIKEYNAAPRATGRVAAFLRGRTELTNIDLGRPDLNVPPPEPAAPKNNPVETEDDSRRVSLAVSHKFNELLQKLRAFEALVAKGRHDRAAVVAADVQQLIQSFDPRAYFPELFSEFAALMSDHVGTITAHMEMRESPSWNALDQFYRVDLKAFVER